MAEILVQIVEMSRKTHLRKISHDVLGLPIFWDRKSQHFDSESQEDRFHLDFSTI